MIGFYLVILIVICMIWYAGYEGTMRLFQYIDLELRYLIVRVRMHFLKKKLERQLRKDFAHLSTIFQENQDERPRR